MNYNHSLNNGGGWPLNLFLTPDLEPVFGGTYWAGPGVVRRTEAAGADEQPLEFLAVLKKLQDVWPAEEPRVREEVRQSVIDLRQYSGEGTLSSSSSNGGGGSGSGSSGVDEPEPEHEHDEVDLDQIEEAYTRIGGTFDPMFGGFGQYSGEGPKFPTTAKLSFLLRATRWPGPVRDVVGEGDCGHVSTMALHTLRRMVLGGMHDHVGGGFHRHSVTRDWSLPTFEKTLADNALLLALYLDAWLLVSGGAPDGEFADTVLEIADYITSSPIASSRWGGFITSEAADSHHRKGDKVKRQGAYYLWTRKEFDTVIGDEQASQVAATYFDVQEHGNVDPSRDPNDEFLNQNVLRIVKNEARLGKQFNGGNGGNGGNGSSGSGGVVSSGAGAGAGGAEHNNNIKSLVDGWKQKLRVHRQRERVQPDLDTKIVTAYNGMAIAALARTAAALAHADSSSLTSKAKQYLDAAKKAALFIQKELWDDSSSTGTLYRAFSSDDANNSGGGGGGGGRMTIEAFAEDYAFLVEGLLELYEATADDSWLRWAQRLQDRQLELFYDEPTTTTNTTNHTATESTTAGTATAPHTTMTTTARCGAFYSTRLRVPHVILRIKDAMDAAQPSANAVSASNLFRLGGLLPSLAISGGSDGGAKKEAEKGERYSELARQTVRAFGIEMLEHPHLFPGLLCGVVPLKLGGRHWVVVDGGGGGGGGGKKEDVEVFTRAFYRAPRSGLFTLAFVDTSRQGMITPGVGIEGPGVYSLDAKTGQYRRLDARGDAELLHEVVTGPAAPTPTAAKTDG